MWDFTFALRVIFDYKRFLEDRTLDFDKSLLIKELCIPSLQVFLLIVQFIYQIRDALK